jgi:hypothetical protein
MAGSCLGRNIQTNYLWYKHADLAGHGGRRKLAGSSGRIPVFLLLQSTAAAAAAAKPGSAKKANGAAKAPTKPASPKSRTALAAGAPLTCMLCCRKRHAMPYLCMCFEREVLLHARLLPECAKLACYGPAGCTVLGHPLGSCPGCAGAVPSAV